MALPEKQIRGILADLAPMLSSRDQGPSLKDDAAEMLGILDTFPNRTVGQMLTRTEQLFGFWRHDEIAEYLGRTSEQIDRYIKRGLPWQSVEKMTPRIEALFAIAVHLEDFYCDNFRAKRRIMDEPDDVNIGGLSIAEIISIGETEIPLALVHRALTQHIEVEYNQRELAAEPI